MTRVAFCLTGEPFSHLFLQAWTQLIHTFLQEGIFMDIRIHSHKNPYTEKNLCLGGPRTKHVSQHPFEEGNIPDAIVWLNAKCLFSPSQVKMLLSDLKHTDMVAGIFQLRHGQYYSAIKQGGPFSSFLTTEEIEMFMKEHPRSLMDVEFADLSFCGMRTEVFSNITYPWCTPQIVMTEDACEFLSPDFSLCKILRDRGYRLAIDPSLRVMAQVEQI